MRCVVCLLGLVLSFYVGRMLCPHCASSMRQLRVANRDRDLYRAEAFHLAVGKSST